MNLFPTQLAVVQDLALFSDPTWNHMLELVSRHSTISVATFFPTYPPIEKMNLSKINVREQLYRALLIGGLSIMFMFPSIS
jgi:hypothetical protein